MKINSFDGGKSVRVDPSLINLNEAVCMVNVDNTSLTLKSCCGLLDVANTIIGGYFYNYNGQWISSTVERSYVEYKNKLYYTEKNSIPKKYDGSKELRLGIEAPINKLVIAQADPVGTEKISDVDTVLQYVYTYYNSQEGVESAPSPLSDELSLTAGKVVNISNIEVSTDVQVDKIRIYRLGAGATAFTLFKEIDNFSDTIKDDVPTLSLIGTLLETIENQAPLSGLQHLVEAYGSLFAALGSKLYFTPPGSPDYWPAQYYLDFPDDITGLLPVPNGILVFSRTKTHILLGRIKDDFAVDKVSVEQGCISHLSCKNCKNIPFWVSLDGICTYGSGTIMVISNDKLDRITLDVVNAAVFNEQYFLCLTNGTLLCMDLRFNQHYKEFKFDKFINNIHNYDNQLYARVGDRLCKLFYSGLEKLYYKSGKLTEGDYTVTKLYNNIYVKSCGEFEFTVFVGDRIVAETKLSGDTIHDIMGSMEDQRGEYIQFEIKGTGVVHEIEYKVVGRQNGR